MNSLIQTSSQPPADTSIPLSASGEHARSGWHAIASEHRQDPTTEYGFGRFVRCVWPTEWLREQLGPYALLPDSALASCEISGVQKKGGQWWARIPRFFTTIGVFWSMTYQSPLWQSHGLFDAADEAAVGSLDLGFSLTAHEPNLIVGPLGPVFYEGPKEGLRGRGLPALRGGQASHGPAAEHPGDSGVLARHETTGIEPMGLRRGAALFMRATVASQELRVGRMGCAVITAHGRHGSGDEACRGHTHWAFVG
jgi:hypothetical protein